MDKKKKKQAKKKKTKDKLQHKGRVSVIAQPNQDEALFSQVTIPS